MRPLRRLWLSLLVVILLGAYLPPLPTAAADPDYPIANGHFYSQTAHADGQGFTIVDDADASFWSEFRRLGGVPGLGYPISQRFVWDGFVSQAMQKVVLQWRPEAQAAYTVNLFDLMHQAGHDGYLEVVRQTPPPRSWDDAGRPWPEVVERHLAVMQGWPAIAAKYRSVSGDPLVLNGLPTSDVVDMGNNYALRAQRVVFQQWKVDTPWAAAGDVTVANGGDVAKEVGLLPAAALAPVPAPPPLPAVSSQPAGQRLAGMDRIRDRVAELRGLPFRQEVDMRLITREELAAWYARELNQPGAQRALRTEQLLWTLLGLLPEGTDLGSAYLDLYSAQIIGFYVIEEKRLYVLADAAGNFDPRAELTLAHELIHVLQDQYFNLGAFLDEDAVGSSDAAMARGALVEGDAVLTMSLYARRYLTAAQIAAVNATIGSDSAALARTPLILRERLAFPYTTGTRLVNLLYNTFGWPGVNQAFERPPASSAQVLHPERYPLGDPPTRPVLPDLAPVLGPTWYELDRDALGELVLRTALRQFLGIEVAAPAAEGWIGDSYALLSDTSGQGALAGQIDFENATEAAQFADAYARATRTRFGTGSLVEQSGGRSVFQGSPAVVVEHRGASVVLALAPTAAQAGQLAAAIP